jgi:tetratricopeptide (TPR) repeat protein
MTTRASNAFPRRLPGVQAAALLAILFAPAVLRASEDPGARAAEHLAKGEFAPALEEAGKALEADPDDIRARVLQGEALEGLGRGEEALEAFRNAYVASLPEMETRDRACRGILRRLHAAALEADARGDGAGAMSCVNEALVFDPDFLDAILLRGRLLEDQGRAEEADEEFRTALLKQPGSPDALLHAARLRLRARRYAEALPLLEKMIAAPEGTVPPGSLAWAHLNAARVCAEEGRRGRALAHLRRASALDPADPAIQSALGDLESFRRQAERVSRAETLAVLAAYAALGILAWRRFRRRAAATGGGPAGDRGGAVEAPR